MRFSILILSLFLSQAQAQAQAHEFPENHEGEVANAPFIAEDLGDLTSGYVDPKTKVSYEQLVRYFNGHYVYAENYPFSPEGFQQYLNDVGVRYTSAQELIIPRRESSRQKMEACKLKNLLPAHEFWERGAALGKFFDSIRSHVGAPIAIRNWYRPTCYNSKVGGEPNSDHLRAMSMDIDFKSVKDRFKAQKFLCDNFWESLFSDSKKRLNLSVGLGHQTLHLGLLSNIGKGRRDWGYPGYQHDPVLGGPCFKDPNHN